MVANPQVLSSPAHGLHCQCPAAWSEINNSHDVKSLKNTFPEFLCFALSPNQGHAAVCPMSWCLFSPFISTKMDPLSFRLIMGMRLGSGSGHW